MNSNAKYLGLLIILFSYQIIYGQRVKVQIKIITPCSPIPIIDSSTYYAWDIQIEGTTEKISEAFINNDSLGVIVLPKPGTYWLNNFERTDSKPIYLEMISKDTIIFINEHKIVQYNQGHGMTYYQKCGQIINGYAEDYYANGNIRIRGNFKKGIPKDSLVTFHPDGIIETSSRYQNNYSFHQHYDSIGRITNSRRATRNKTHPDSYNFHSIDYSKSGLISREEKVKNSIVTLKEYYPNGRFKTFYDTKKRISYFENGKIKLRYSWVFEREELKLSKREWDAIVTKEQFDESGKLIERQIYTDWNTNRKQPNYQIKDCNWIDKWVKFIGGKEILIAKDIEVNKFFELYPSEQDDDVEQD